MYMTSYDMNMAYKGYAYIVYILNMIYEIRYRRVLNDLPSCSSCSSSDTVVIPIYMHTLVRYECIVI